MRDDAKGRLRRLVLPAVVLVTLAGCTAGNWHFVRERPPEKATTEVTVTSHPKGAEVMIDGHYRGRTPFKVKLVYPMAVRVFERQTSFPIPEMETREVHTCQQNTFRFQFRAIGHRDTVRDLTLTGEPTKDLDVTLLPDSK